MVLSVFRKTWSFFTHCKNGADAPTRGELWVEKYVSKMEFYNFINCVGYRNFTPRMTMPAQPTNSISESERIDAFCRELGLILRRILKEAQESDQVHKLASTGPIEEARLVIK